jgi:TIR domain/WD domain, G-beta repeat
MDEVPRLALLDSQSIVTEPAVAPPPGLTLRSTLAAGGKTLRRAAWSPDGGLLAVPGDEPLVRIWEMTRERVKQTLHLDGPAWAVDFWPDGPWLAVAQPAPVVDQLHLETGAIRRRFPVRDNRYATSVQVSWDGKTLAAGSNTGPILLWDVQSGERRHKLPGHAGAVRGLAFQPGQLLLASAGQDHTLELWDAGSGAHRGWLHGHSGPVYAVAWAPDGGVLASGSADGTVRLWDPTRGAEIRRLDGHTGPVVGVSCSADGRILASKSLDGTVRLWRCDTGRQLALLPAPADDRNLFGTVAFHPCAPHLALSAERDTALQIWDLDIDRLLAGPQADVHLPAPVQRPDRVPGKVFLSYSHQDREWLKLLCTTLAPLVRNEAISLWWDESEIRVGAKWQEEIAGALATARLAVLLVSQHFLDSDYITGTELPALLAAAERHELTLLWIHVSPCLYEETPLHSYQAAHDPERSLEEMTAAERKRALVAIGKRIKQVSGRRTADAAR